MVEPGDIGLAARLGWAALCPGAADYRLLPGPTATQALNLAPGHGHTAVQTLTELHGPARLACPSQGILGTVVRPWLPFIKQA